MECERKFLVCGAGWKSPDMEALCQGYLSLDPRRTVRVRVSDVRAWLTVKGEGNGLSRPEFEYEIPLADGKDLLALCADAVVGKRRYRVPHEGHVWEVDEFLGDNRGLVLAEIELDTETQPFTRPPWLGREVSGESRYYNASLATHPYVRW